MSTTEHTPVEAIKLLIDHTSETYPHFESPRGQQDIERARVALARIVNSHADMLEALESMCAHIHNLHRIAMDGKVAEISIGAFQRLSAAEEIIAEAKGGAA